MNSTFGVSFLALNGAGQAGSDSSTVSPMVPEKMVPGLYSLIDIYFSLYYYILWNVSNYILWNVST
jgi:hypothetical protein